MMELWFYPKMPLLAHLPVLIFNVESDFCIEIDITPIRIDGASHFGVARDLAAYLNQTQDIKYNKPSVDNFKVDDNSKNIPIELVNTEACARYSGLTISGIEIKGIA